MKKFILVEVPEDAGKAKIIWYGSPEIESTPPILHGKRALLEECLKVGEFEGNVDLLLTNLDEPEEDALGENDLTLEERIMWIERMLREKGWMR